jgi:hypothetical protein
MNFYVLIALVAGALSASTVQSATKEIDRRLRSDADEGRRQISFCARPTDKQGGGPGHVFVLFETEASNGRSLEFLAIGHVPDGAKKSITPGKGILSPENFTHAGQEYLKVLVDQPRYDSVRKLVEAQRAFKFANI